MRTLLAFTSSNSVSLVTAERRCENALSDGEACDSNDCNQRAEQKLAPAGDSVLLRTCAVRVVNASTGKSTHAYAQHNKASQATLISEGLTSELGLDVDSSRKMKIRTLAEETTLSVCLARFTIQSLTTGQSHAFRDALVVPNFIEGEGVLPHSVDVGKLQHFEGVDVPTISGRKTIDVLIGQSDKLLLTVLEERESLNSDNPNLVFTRLGPIVSEGRWSSDAISSHKVQVGDCSDCKCDQLKSEVFSLKRTLRDLN